MTRSSIGAIARTLALVVCTAVIPAATSIAEEVGDGGSALSTNRGLVGLHIVYNLEVRGRHSYLISNQRVLVHNQSATPRPGLLYVSFAKGQYVKREITVVDGKAYYRSSSGTSGKTQGAWYRLHGIQEAPDASGGVKIERGLVLKQAISMSQGIIDTQPAPELSGMAVDIEVETTSPEAVNGWISSQGAAASSSIFTE
jgi:hypothetical protein